MSNIFNQNQSIQPLYEDHFRNGAFGMPQQSQAWQQPRPQTLPNMPSMNGNGMNGNGMSGYGYQPSVNVDAVSEHQFFNASTIEKVQLMQKLQQLTPMWASNMVHRYQGARQGLREFSVSAGLYILLQSDSYVVSVVRDCHPLELEEVSGGVVVFYMTLSNGFNVDKFVDGIVNMLVHRLDEQKLIFSVTNLWRRLNAPEHGQHGRIWYMDDILMDYIIQNQSFIPHPDRVPNNVNSYVPTIRDSGHFVISMPSVPFQMPDFSQMLEPSPVKATPIKDTARGLKKARLTVSNMLGRLHLTKTSRD